jgi:hypothetical protein
MLSLRVAVVTGITLLVCACGGSGGDPADAACPHPPITFRKPLATGDHREVRVQFTCESARLVPAHVSLFRRPV